VADGYYLAVIRELRGLGFSLQGNAKGSHEKWVDASGRTLIVPKNLKSRHTANGILRDAGSSRHF
jgi:predicted RNA binding protein YcfA (HicA-like mRNA interferase family)